MRVLHIVPMLFDSVGRVRGGAERYALELACSMAQHVPVRLVTFGDQDQLVDAGPLTIRTIGGDWRAHDRSHDPFSIKIVREVQAADVVHCHQREVRISKAAAVLARAFGKTVVATDHGGGAWSWASRIPARRLFHRHLHVSEFSRRLSRQEAWSRATVVGAGVDGQRFAPVANRKRSAHARALFVGRILPHKAIDLLIAALPPAVSLDVIGAVGDPKYRRYLGEVAAGKDVVFLHDVADDQLAKAYQGCLCVVLPSTYRDCYGNYSPAPELLGQTLLEGMASGRPTICTEVGGMPEVVVNGVTGLVVPEGDRDRLTDALSFLGSHRDAAEEMGLRGRVRAESHFSWPAVSHRCLDSYREVGA